MVRKFKENAINRLANVFRAIALPILTFLASSIVMRAPFIHAVPNTLGLYHIIPNTLGTTSPVSNIVKML